ncbi:TadE family protein [Singulisphaera rosea]
MLVSRVRKLRRRRKSRGAAAVELAMLLPFLCYACIATVDFGRVFSDLIKVNNCARNGALFAADPAFASSTNFASAQDAALADASGMSPAPTVSSTSGTDASGNQYVEVTVTYTFQSLTAYPGIPSSVTLTRKVRMMKTPT